ncbi:MAG: hypothetical protein HYR55_08575 [Acidobacteria bacterium]|nr:hypothetical protein [Acidobacteriota bacterium]MBI3656379.1 hypothetical protein [Acidobacteriota bacterium]
MSGGAVLAQKVAPASSAKPVAPSAGAADARLSRVKVASSSFNPSAGERLSIRFTLSSDAAVTLKIFDPDFELIRALWQKKPLRAGNHTATWDGKDMDGKIVPNEAYFFTIEAQVGDGLQTVYDPITFSGGEVYDITKADFDRENNSVTYTLERPGRVLIRLGIHNGPLLRTLVDWKPHLPGLVTEPWNGRDESGVIDIRQRANFTTLVTYFTLPENSVIAFGNNKVTYADYKQGHKGQREKQVVRERRVPTTRSLSPHFLLPRTQDRALKVSLSFPEIKPEGKNAAITVRGLTLIRVDVAEAFRNLISQQPFEIMFFLDQVFFAEEESGHIPYNFQWDFSSLGPGEHVLTVNIATLNDQIGAASVRIFVKKD